MTTYHAEAYCEQLDCPCHTDFSYHDEITSRPSESEEEEEAAAAFFQSPEGILLLIEE